MNGRALRYAFAVSACLLAAVWSPFARSDLAPDAHRSRACTTAENEVFVPAGYYYPFFKTGKTTPAVPVKALCLDAAPVTHEQFLHFVNDHPQWRKSQVKALFAEDTYLSDWQGDLAPQPELLSQPVTSVSWFAARAYCETGGGRLPTVAEWERFAGGGAPVESKGTTRSSQRAENAAGAAPFLFAMGQRAPDLAGTPLVLSGVWEWTANFNSALVSGRMSTAEGADSSLFCGDGFRATNPSNYGAFLRHSFRSSLRANFALKNLGFRCAGEPAGEPASGDPDSGKSPELSERSIYQLDSSWTEDSGHALKLRELTGHVQVLTLIFTTCTGSCPVTVKALQMFSRDLGDDIRDRSRFLLVTVDPERDTLAALRQYRRDMKLDGKRWTLLRGSAPDVRELAAVLGFNYEQIDSGQFVHSSLVTVLDQNGEIVHQQNGVTGSRDELLDAVRRAMRAEGIADR